MDIKLSHRFISGWQDLCYFAAAARHGDNDQSGKTRKNTDNGNAIQLS